MTSGRNLKICVIDDQFPVRKGYVSLLSTIAWGAKIDDFDNSNDALTLISVHSPDILITDMQIPSHMGGTEGVIRCIREIKSKKPDCLVIVTSGYNANDAMATIKSTAHRLDSDDRFKDFRPAIVDAGTGDDADTPSMRERAARRSAERISGNELLKLIDHFLVKTPDDTEFITLIENYMQRIESSKELK